LPALSPAILIISRLPQAAQHTGQPRPTIAAEAGDQHVHVERSEAMPSRAPRADAIVVGIDKVPKSFDCVAGHPSRVRMRETSDKSGSAMDRRP
jgi:hypothetical protein